MGSSDSETESECFESAEESLDELEEKKDEKPKLKKNLQKSDKDSKPVGSDCHVVNSVCAVEGDSSNSSLSYRKRPERVKRLPSNSQTKSIPKSSTNELIFKTDKIVPDVFLQDITSNLSKNLNKSLSTLQQKSSNVKDLILNSLPVSSVSDNEVFSYDDKSVLLDFENKSLEPEPNHESNKQCLEFDEKVNEKNTNGNKEILGYEISTTETDLSVINKESDSSNERESSDIKSPNVDYKSTNDDFKEEIFNIDKESLEECSSALIDSETSKISSGNCTELLNIEPNKKDEITEDFNTCLNSENSTKLADEECEIIANKLESVNIAEETTQEIETVEKNENICFESEINEEVKEKNETFESDKFSELLKSDNSADNFDENNVNQMTEEKNKIDAECNLEELKTVLKNIVNEENISVKENENLDDNKEVVDNSGDGWDDFDFSDDEAGNFNEFESHANKESVDNKKNNADAKSTSPVLDTKSCNNKTEVETKKSENVFTSGKNLKETSRKTKSFAEKVCVSDIKSHEVKKEENKATPKSKKLSETTSIVENELWDWDNWDDEQDNKEVENSPSGKSNVNKDSLDVSKWSGWDTFGQKPQEKQDNWSFGSWGVDALLNKATVVTQGISSVLEAGLGAPDPETLARMEKIERENLSEPIKEVIENENASPAEISKKNSLTNVNIFPVSGITSLVAGVTSKIVEHSKLQEIGTKVITGGLETLETFGKKTMEVLQEGDPGLKNKRALLLGNNKPVLSQVLKEAREKADRESKKAEEKELAKKCHFETLFDDFQGMVHLEALEMLSRQCELKLDQIKSGMNSEEQEDLNGILEEVEQLCSLDEYDIDMKSSVLDFKALLQMVVEPLKNEISIKNIIQIHEDVNKWLQTSLETEPSFAVINQKLVSTLAEITAATVHQFHKSGELLSVKECRKTVEEVDALSRLTNALCLEINKLGEKFIKLSCSRTSEDISGDSVNSINEKVNNVMKNSVFYIKQAFNLLIPVIQLGAAV